jgi:anti-sigma B factor antagonist
MVQQPNFDISEKLTGSTLTVAVSGELDMNTVSMLTEHLDGRLNGHVTEVIVDLRDLEFMDSSGLRLLIELNDRSQAETWQLALVAPTAEAAAVVLRVTGADSALPFKRSEDS